MWLYFGFIDLVVLVVGVIVIAITNYMAWNSRYLGPLNVTRTIALCYGGGHVMTIIVWENTWH